MHSYKRNDILLYYNFLYEIRSIYFPSFQLHERIHILDQLVNLIFHLQQYFFLLALKIYILCYL
uniref:Uncharacterized protein n=1 Tax=Clostridium botulinum TaxID=1491 RepID=A0A0A0UTU2_CLOBO|nr:hypothetical protein [Clostridium botulinum]AIW54932.1 hypothetical protein [Clostridium botulinum]AIW54987.1 hypothetical protein [Clostridium botulinum]AIW55042.1 hypothetical protein [Clostridium botulinum]